MLIYPEFPLPEHLMRGVIGWFAAHPDAWRSWRSIAGQPGVVLSSNSVTNVTRIVTKRGFAVRGNGTANSAFLSGTTNWNLSTTFCSFGVWAFMETATAAGIFFRYGQGGPGNGISLGVGSTSVDGTGGNVAALVDNVRHVNIGVSYGGIGLHYFGLTLGAGSTMRVHHDGRRIYNDSLGGPTFSATALHVLGHGLNDRNVIASVLDLKVWTRALADHEHGEIYRAGLRAARSETRRAGTVAAAAFSPFLVFR